MVDAPRLRALLARLESRLGQLRMYGATAEDVYVAHPESVYASKYLLLTAIEDALAAANHVIAAEGYRSPMDYADAFQSLAEAGRVSPQLASALQAMARFRNLLVHGYADVDDRRVHSFLREDLGDLQAFLKAMVAAFPE